MLKTLMKGSPCLNIPLPRLSRSNSGIMHYPPCIRQGETGKIHNLSFIIHNYPVAQKRRQRPLSPRFSRQGVRYRISSAAYPGLPAEGSPRRSLPACPAWPGAAAGPGYSGWSWDMSISASLVVEENSSTLYVIQLAFLSSRLVLVW